MFTFLITNNKDTTEYIRQATQQQHQKSSKNPNNNDKKAAFMNVVHKPAAKNAIMY